MALIASGISQVGRTPLNGISVLANQTHTIYFPGLNFQFVGLIGGIALGQIDTPVGGIYRSEQFQEFWTYSERYVPLNQSNRVFILWFKEAGLSWEIHR